jgi:hypothetical protein
MACTEPGRMFEEKLWIRGLCEKFGGGKFLKSKK